MSSLSFSAIREDIKAKRNKRAVRSIEASKLSIAQYRDLLKLAEHMGSSERVIAVLNDRVKAHRSHSTVKITLTSKTPSVCTCESTSFTYRTSLPFATAKHTFAGYKCNQCSAIWVLQDTYNNLKPEILATISVIYEEEDENELLAKKLKTIRVTEQNFPFWWGKTLPSESIDTSEWFALLEGTGQMELGITLGIDFGASTTKIVTRVTHGPKSAFIDPIKLSESLICEPNSEDFLTQSLVYITPDKRLSLGHKEMVGKERRYFKSILVNEAYIGTDPDEIYYAIFFIANMLNLGLKKIKETYPPNFYRRAAVNVVMGMPVSTTVGVLPNLFRRILAAAHELKDYPGLGSPLGVPLLQWKNMCRNIGPNIKHLKWFLTVQPEVYAEVLHLFNSTFGPGRCALVIDIGSSTLDLAYFFNIKPLFPDLYIPIAEVFPLGIEMVSAELLRRYPGKYSSLGAAKEALMQGSVPRKFTNIIRDRIGETMQGVFKKIEAVKRHFHDPSGGDEIPIYFFGGGKEVAWYRGLLYAITHANENDLSFVIPQWTPKTIQKVPSHLLYRFQVSIGLAEKKPKNLRLKGLPYHFEEFFEQEAKKHKRAYIDMEDLQASIYGR